MTTLRTLVLLLLLTLPASAAPQGTYVGVFFGTTEEVTITADRFVSVTTGEGLPAEGFRLESPIARVGPGRFVLGPAENTDEPYEAVFFGGEKPDRVRIYRDGRRFATAEEALEAPGPSRRASLYWTRARFEELQALPTLPPPGRETLLALLGEALERMPAIAGLDVQDEVMVGLMIQKGFNPFSSRAVFIEARERFASDPEVEDLLARLKARAEGP